MRTVPAVLVAIAAVFASATVRAQDVSGTVDIEVNGDTSAKATFDAPGERHIYRLSAPRGVTVKVSVFDDSPSFGTPNITGGLFTRAGQPVSTLSFSSKRRANLEFAGDASGGRVLRLKHRDLDAGVDIGNGFIEESNYRVVLQTKIPKKAKGKSVPSGGVAKFDFPALAGMTTDITLAIPRSDAGRMTGILLRQPNGEMQDITPPASQLSGRKIKLSAIELGASGDFQLWLNSAGTGKIRATMKLIRSDDQLYVDLSRSGGGPKSRVVGGPLGSVNSQVVTPAPGKGQKVQSDFTGGNVATGSTYSRPTAVSIQSSDPIAPLNSNMSPTSTPIGLGSGITNVVGNPAVQTPYDTAAYPDGTAEMCVLRKNPDGTTTEITDFTVDPIRGTVTHAVSPGARKSPQKKNKTVRRRADISLNRRALTTYQIFGPKRTISTLISGGIEDVATDFPALAANGDVFATGIEGTSVWVTDAQTRTSSLYAGGGPFGSRFSGTHRLDFDFDVVTAITLFPWGDVLVAELAFRDEFNEELEEPAGILWWIYEDLVYRVAGDFYTPFTAENVLSYETGFDAIVGLTTDAEGHVFLATLPENQNEFDEGAEFDPVLGGAVWRIDIGNYNLTRIAGLGSRAVADGVPPRDTNLIGPFTFRGQPLQVDGRGRVYLVTDLGERLIRFDLAANRTETVVAPFYERKQVKTGPPDDNLSEGAPIANVDFGWFESISIDPDKPDQLYVLDVFFELAWRLDVERDRCYVVAGDSTQSKPLVQGGSPRVRLEEGFLEDFPTEFVFPTGIAARHGAAVIPRLIFAADEDQDRDRGELLIVK